MRKLYLSLCMLLAGMCPLLANAFTITFNVDHPENVCLEIYYEEQQLNEGGDNTFLFTGSFTPISISGKNGCKVTVKGPDGNDIEETGVFFSNEQKYGGKNITITSQKPEEYRTESVKVNIDKASAVKISANKEPNNVSYYPELTDGDNTIYYEPGVDKMLRIYSSVSTQVPLYSVTVENGTTEAIRTNFVYDVALPCDGDVVVKGVFPDKECTVTLNYGEGIEGFVDKITKDTATGEDIDFSAGSFKVNAGTVLYIHGNTNEYLLESYKVDDAIVSFNTPQRLVVIDKDINVSFAGRKYNKFNVNITVDNPAYVVAKVGTSLNPGAVIALEKGKNVIPFSENDPNVFFTSSNNHDYKITAITYNGENIMADYSGAFKIQGLKADDKIEIATAEIVRDLEAVVYENSTIYNIQGIRINKTAEELPAGLYIINGKKVLVK